jgi:hypothetical protein
MEWATVQLARPGKLAASQPKSLWKIDQDQGIPKFFDMLPLATFQLKRIFSKIKKNDLFSVRPPI